MCDGSGGGDVWRSRWVCGRCVLSMQVSVGEVMSDLVCRCECAWSVVSFG